MYCPDDGEKMKRINDAVDFVMGMKVVRRRRPAPMRFAYSPTSAGASTSFTTTFNTTVNLDEVFGALFDD